MSSAGESRLFMFSVSFILIFSALLVTIPLGLSGAGGTGNELNAINPNLVTDFADDTNFTGEKGDFFGITGTYYWYDNLGGYDWYIEYNDPSFTLGSKDYFLGLVWLGALNPVEFFNEDSINRGTDISWTEIDADAESGVTRYNLIFESAGTDAGTFIIYYNTTTYTDAQDAWDHDALAFVHGVGVTANTNIVSLLLGVLFLQLPDTPLLVNVLLATPIWSAVVFLIWYIIKESIPFL